jgi:threonine dehydratase
LADAVALIEAVRASAPLQELEVGTRGRVVLKREDLGPTGTFKWRGALTACYAYRDDGVMEVVTASTGNHGAAVAWAATRLGMTAHVVVPRHAVSRKRALITAHGGQLHRSGDDLDGASTFAMELASRRGIPYFEDGGSEAQLDGVATVGTELAASSPLDAVFVPVGCGALAAGVAAGLKRQSCTAHLVGVQSVHFSRLTASFHGQSYVPTGEPTFADGLADDRVIEPAFSSCKRGLDDLITVDEGQLRDAVRMLWRLAGIRAEGAGAAALAGLLSYPQDRIAGRVAVIISGGNLDPAVAHELLGESAASSKQSVPEPGSGGTVAPSMEPPARTGPAPEA